MSPVNIAILGGGIFVQEAHLPALKDVGPSAKIAAIYSRSEASAKASVAVAEKLGLGTPDVYYDAGNPGSTNLKALLERKDIQAVIIALPITTQAAVVIQCLEAGKHVLSEKPVGKDVAEGMQLVEQYEKEFKPKGLIWRIAENWEVEPAYLLIKEAIASGKIGKVQTFTLVGINYVSPVGNKWYATPWRTKPEYQGGFLLDGGVHSAAFLRTVLPAPIVALSGFATLLQEHLAPNDCIHSTLKCADGAQGYFNLNVGASGYEGGGLTQILGDSGSIDVSGVQVDGKPAFKVVIKVGKKGEQKEEVYTERSVGVQKEQEYFFAAVNGTSKDDYGNPRGAVRDVAVIQGSLTSNGNLVDFSKLIPGY